MVEHPAGTRLVRSTGSNPVRSATTIGLYYDEYEENEEETMLGMVNVEPARS